MTGYRRGDKVKCGRDATGYKLYARSAVKCARRGMNWREILRKYYSPYLDMVENGRSSSASSAGASAATAPSSGDGWTAQARSGSEAPSATTPSASDIAPESTALAGRRSGGLVGSTTGGFAEALEALVVL